MKPTNQKMLDRATKQPRTETLQHADKPCEAEAQRLAAQIGQLAELKREVDQAKQALIDKIRPWHEDACRRTGTYTPTVTVGPIQLSFQHRYNDIAPAQLPEIASLFDHPERYFQTRTTVKVRPQIAEDHKEFEAMLDMLRDRLGPTRFARYFEAAQKVVPLPRYTEEQASLPEETRAKLAPVVKQVVSVSLSAA